MNTTFIYEYWLMLMIMRQINAEGEDMKDLKRDRPVEREYSP